MTSLLRKKLQITVRNSLRRLTTSRLSCPHPRLRHRLLNALRDSLPSGAGWLNGLLFGLVIASPCVAQQPAAWSPQPFAKPNTEGSSTQPNVIPQNSLRPNEKQPNGDVARWGSPNKEARPTNSVQSFAPVMPPQGTQPPTSPRSGFELSNGVESNATRTQVTEPAQPTSHVRLTSYNESSVEAPSHERRTSGVWYDRSAANDNASLRTTKIQKARFQEPQSEAPAPFLPPATDKLPAAPSILDNQFDRNSARSLNEVLEPSPSKLQIPPTKPGRSLLEQEQIPSNPFPGTKTPKQADDESSPSDSKEPPSMNSRKDLDAAPSPPRRLDRSVVDCDSVRLLAKESDITKIRIDSSPSFVEGYKNKDRSAANTKESFIASAPIRPWLSYEGQVVAEGKLVDLKLGSVILERADGTRTSYLLHKLSDADQVYVSEKWGLPVTCSIDDRSFPSRDFVDTTVTWKASGACHKPLYFEDVQLERYGHEWGPVVQPVLSTAHFFGDVVVLPYKMGIHPLNECQYSLGYYRPGSCAPWTIGPVPISLRGALLQAKVVTGAALILP